MTFPDRNMERSGFSGDQYPIGGVGNSPMWMIVVVAVVAVLGLMFYFGSASSVHVAPDQGAIQQPTQPAPIPAPAPSPTKPATPNP
jgi:hypothetical protein